MGRAENRKSDRALKKKLTPQQLQDLKKETNTEYIEQELKKRVKNFQIVFTECLEEAFKKNGISKSKSMMVMDDIQLIMIRKSEEKGGINGE